MPSLPKLRLKLIPPKDAVLVTYFSRILWHGWFRHNFQDFCRFWMFLGWGVAWQKLHRQNESTWAGQWPADERTTKNPEMIKYGKNRGIDKLKLVWKRSSSTCSWWYLVTFRLIGWSKSAPAEHPNVFSPVWWFLKPHFLTKSPAIRIDTAVEMSLYWCKL